MFMINHQKSAAPYRSFMPFLACLMGTIPPLVSCSTMPVPTGHPSSSSRHASEQRPPSVDQTPARHPSRAPHWHHLGHAAVRQGAMGAVTGSALGGLGVLALDQLRHEARYGMRRVVDGALRDHGDRHATAWVMGGLATGLLVGTALGYAMQPQTQVSGMAHDGRAISGHAMQRHSGGPGARFA